jgi:hypothetical protein
MAAVPTIKISFHIIHARPKEMNPFLYHAVPRVVPLLSRAPVHSAMKFQSCGFKNSSCNKSTRLSSFHAFIIELYFILVFFFASFQLQYPTSHMYYKNTIIMRYCYNNFNHKCQICFIQENRVSKHELPTHNLFGSCSCRNQSLL